MDYSERKKYLNMINKKNIETLEELKELAKEAHYEQERKKEEDSRKQFNNIVSNLHHLMSTSTIPGVYNNPNLSEETKPQVYNADIETHLKSAFKVLVFLTLVKF